MEEVDKFKGSMIAIEHKTRGHDLDLIEYPELGYDEFFCKTCNKGWRVK